MVRNRVVFALVVIGGLAGATSAAAQFRAGTTLVVVDVTVTGRDGGVVTDLAAADFELLEDGVPQTLQQVRLFDASATPPVAVEQTGAVSNAVEPGGIFALVADEPGISAFRTQAARRWARFFVEQVLQPQDYAVIARSGVNTGLLLSNQRALLMEMAGRITGQATGGPGAPAMGGGVPTDLGGLAVGPTRGNMDASSGLITLRHVVERLGAIASRRKAVIWLSPGVNADVAGALNSSDRSRASERMNAVLRAALTGNVAIYGVDPRGLYVEPNMDAGPVSPMAPSDVLDSLRDLSRLTGGRAIVNTNDVGGALQQIARENRAYYLLGYMPAAPENKRRSTRRLDVRVKRPGLTVHHRTAYVPDATAAPAATGIASPMPHHEILVTVTTMVERQQRNAAVSASFDVRTGAPGGTTTEVMVMAIDLSGDIRARQTTRVVAAPDGLARGVIRLSLRPGAYQLRTMAIAAGRRGSVFSDLIVPAR